MFRNWRILIEGVYHELEGCTTCRMRKYAHKILNGRGGEVVVERMFNGEYREYLTFTVPKGVSRGGTTTNRKRRSSVRGVSEGVRTEGRNPKHSEGGVRRPGSTPMSHVLWKPREQKHHKEG